MTDNHPITPPPELLQEWIDEPQYLSEDWLGKRMNMVSMNEVKFKEIINKASQYGADQELEAMLAELKALHLPDGYAARLRAARRPKPPSLKEQALALLDKAENPSWDINDFSIIRQALEAL